MPFAHAFLKFKNIYLFIYFSGEIFATWKPKKRGSR
jgi:hypothetical protein